MKPGRGRCLVRRVETTEQFAGGKIVLPVEVREKIAAQQVEILAVGEWKACADDSCNRPHRPTPWVWGADERTPIFLHEFHGKQGDWALIAPRSLTECGDESGQTFLVNQDDVLAILSP